MCCMCVRSDSGLRTQDLDRDWTLGPGTQMFDMNGEIQIIVAFTAVASRVVKVLCKLGEFPERNAGKNFQKGFHQAD
ncbi:hypothetical protein E4U16_001702 [Claviceps sp. LM84 group G4]|nr:hypothetical protein E4U16_001702 [Claviceps sp. LM84 group G4]KAG6080727.1 hypothetical protein E4U33_007349 [Claviceps sp. LM78 group G4]